VPTVEIDFLTGGVMDILAAIKREEKRLEKQVDKIQQQLNGVRAAAKALGGSASKELKAAKKRVLSAAGRAKISRAAKKRWAKIRAQAKKVTG
jgi:cell division septum initiation protein DivIVA